MENNKEIIENVFEITQTGLDALNYMKLKVDEEAAEVPLYLLEDVISGIMAVNVAIDPFLIDLPKNKIDVLRVDMEKGIASSVKAMEDNDEVLLKEFLQGYLIKSYTKWKKEIDKNLNKIIDEKKTAREKKSS